MVISAQHEDLPDSFIIEIEAAKVQHLLNEFNNDFNLMAQHLKIMNKRMVLLNPVSIFYKYHQSYSNLYSYRNLLPSKKEKKDPMMNKKVLQKDKKQTKQRSLMPLTLTARIQKQKMQKDKKNQ